MICGRFCLDLNNPKIMGILNVTPDSFSDGGRFFQYSDALKHAENMLRDGADILDIGAESTRPNSFEVPAEEEIRRLTPVIQELIKWNVPISIDTKKTAVMKAVLELGVDMINDVNGLEDLGAVELLSNYNAGICIMHMRGTPENMQHTENIQYSNVVVTVRDYLHERAALCEHAGIDKARICLDYGFGFAKTPPQNMSLVKHTSDFGDFPILVGVSRKSTIGHYLDDAPLENRLIGSVTLAALSAFLGAKILRVHDVLETRDALKIVKALKNAD